MSTPTEREFARQLRDQAARAYSRGLSARRTGDEPTAAEAFATHDNLMVAHSLVLTEPLGTC